MKNDGKTKIRAGKSCGYYLQQQEKLRRHVAIYGAHAHKYCMNCGTPLVNSLCAKCT